MQDKYLEDYEIGQSWASGGRTVTEADIVNLLASVPISFHCIWTRSMRHEAPSGNVLPTGF